MAGQFSDSSSVLPASVRAVLRRYSDRIDVEQVLATTLFSGFSQARVWKIEIPPAVWALRCWPSPGLPPERLNGLHHLLRHVQSCGLNFVAAPIAADSGETLITHEKLLWQVEPWLPGTANFQEFPSERRLGSVMAALARWHAAAATFVPDRDSKHWFASQPDAVSPAVQERLATLKGISQADFANIQSQMQGNLPAEVRQTLADFLTRLPLSHQQVMARLSACQHQRFTLQPCLRDIWHDHVLFTGDDVTGLIDASACRADHVATDLSRLIGSLVEEDRNAWHTALSAYRQFHHLTPEEERLVRALDISGVWLSAWTWLQWLIAQRRSFANSEAVLARLRHLKRRVAVLVECGRS